ncbi:hypothetical protein GGR52DRAFT_296258 [Hypoxylon sp. FL1284]|nr:hypothetical protein GGR52DRAFT_296258 [Hypoxylon sp. FL1284]
MSQSQGGQNGRTYQEAINELVTRSATRLAERIVRLNDELRNGVYTQAEYDQRLNELNRGAALQLDNRRAQIDASFGRQQDVLIEQALEDLQLGDNEEEELMLADEFDELWSQTSDEMPLLPAVHRAYPAFDALPDDVLMDIAWELGSAELLRLSVAYPNRFLTEQGINVYRTDASRLRRNQTRSGEHPMMVYAINEGYSLDVIRNILEVYESYFGRGQGANIIANGSPTFLQTAIRAIRPEVVSLLLDWGASLRVGPMNWVELDIIAERVFDDLVRSSPPSWGYSRQLERARESYVFCLIARIENTQGTVGEELDRIFSNRGRIFSNRGEGHTIVYMTVINTIMSRPADDDLRQSVAAALPGQLSLISSHPWGMASRIRQFVSGSRQEVQQIACAARIDSALRFLILRHGVAVDLRMVLRIGEQNPRAANIIIESIRERQPDAGNKLLLSLIEQAPRKIRNLAYFSEGLVPLLRVDSESQQLRARLLIMAVRHNNEKLIRLLLQEDMLPPAQAMFYALERNDAALFDALMHRGEPEFMLVSVVQSLQSNVISIPSEQYDWTDNLVRAGVRVLDLALYFRNYRLFNALLQRDREAFGFIFPYIGRQLSQDNADRFRAMVATHTDAADPAAWRAQLGTAAPFQLAPALLLAEQQAAIQPVDLQQLYITATFIFPSEHPTLLSLEQFLGVSDGSGSSQASA